jgi:hypothetical protein
MIFIVVFGLRQVNVSIATAGGGAAGTGDEEGRAAAGTCTVVKDLGCFDQELGGDAKCFNISDQSALGYGRASLEGCLDYCWRMRAADDNGAAPVSYIGLESGYQCWCSTAAPGHANSSACPSLPISRCDSKCGLPPPPPPQPPLPNGTTCGGGWALRAYEVDCSHSSTVPPPRRRLGDTIAAFATADESDAVAVATVAGASGARLNVSVFISSWDSSLPPQGSPAAQAAPPPQPVALHVALPPGSALRIASSAIVKIDEQHANPRAAYLEMNTGWPSAAQLKELEAASAATEESLKVAAGGMHVELTMPPNAAYTVLLHLES